MPDIDWETFADDSITMFLDVFSRYLKAYADIGNADAPVNVVPAHHLLEFAKKKSEFNVNILKSNLMRVMELTGYYLGKMATEIKDNLYEVKWHYYKETSLHPRNQVPPELLESSSGSDSNNADD